MRLNRGLLKVLCLFTTMMWTYGARGEPTDPENMYVMPEESYAGRESASRYRMSYYGVVYGPSISKPSGMQPDSNGVQDPTRPLLVRNFLGLGYQLTPEITASATAYWTWQTVIGHPFSFQDPFLMISHNSLINTRGFNLYADLRAHMAVSSVSRENDLLFGAQTFQAFTYNLAGVGYPQWTIGLYSSERVNFFGKQGYGDTFELYLCPNLYYQFTPSLAFSLLYGYQASKFYRMSGLHRDSVSFQPGLTWDITPQLTFNPYLNIPTDGNLALKSVSLGMFLSWNLL